MPKATFVFDLGGSECMSTLDVLHAGVSEYTAAISLGQFMKDGWMTYASEDCVLEEVRLGETIAPITGGAGQVAEPSLPASCALILQKNTGSTLKGRMMLPGILEEDVSAGGEVSSTLRGLVNASMADARSALLTAGVGCYVVSSMTAGSSAAINTFTVRPLIATLRNRLIGR